jgi:hypothetical protein
MEKEKLSFEDEIKGLEETDALKNLNSDANSRLNIKAFFKNSYAVILTILIFAALYVTPLGAPLFRHITLEVFASAFGVLFAVNIMLATSWREKGKERGKGTEEFKEGAQKIKEVIKSIPPDAMPKLDEECSKLTERIQRSEREAILKNIKISYTEYETKYLGQDRRHIKRLAKPTHGAMTRFFMTIKARLKNVKYINEKTQLSKYQAKNIIKANKIKREKLNIDMLVKLNSSLNRKRIKLRPSERQLDRNFYTRKIISKIILTALFAAISKDLLAGGFSTAELGWYLLVCAQLLYSSSNSYFGGQRDITQGVLGRIEDQMTLLKAIGVNTAVKNASKVPQEEEVLITK